MKTILLLSIISFTLLMSGCNSGTAEGTFLSQSEEVPASVELSASLKNKAYSQCLDVIKKYPYTKLIKTLQAECNCFVAVLRYNGEWGMFPQYIYVDKPVNLDDRSKECTFVLDENTQKKVSGLIDKYIDFNKASQFVSFAENSFPPVFDVVIIYQKGKATQLVLSGVDTKATDRYENRVLDNPFLFVSNLADITNTGAMCELVYGFMPIVY